MATISDYLTQLQIDKETLKTNLKAKGVDVLDSDTFTEMTAKVGTMPSGSGIDLNNYFYENIPNGTNSSNSGVLFSIKNFPALKNEGTSCKYMFSNFGGVSIDFSNFETSEVEDMAYMFYQAINLERLDLSSFFTPKLTNTNYMFYNCKSLKYLDMRNFDFTPITSSGIMFYNVPNDCEIIVKDDVARNWILSMNDKFTNIKTLEEIGG